MNKRILPDLSRAAADTGGGAGSAEATEKSRRAFHAYIDGAGARLTTMDGDREVEVDKAQEQAVGCYYRDLATGEETQFAIPGAKAGKVGTMLAVFGLKTLFTNTASQARTQRANGTTELSDVGAIGARIADLKDGQWDVPAERSGGPRYNLDLLARAINVVNPARSVEEARTMLDDEAKRPNGKTYYEFVLTNDEVKAHYRRLAAENAIAAAAAKGGGAAAGL